MLKGPPRERHDTRSVREYPLEGDFARPTPLDTPVVPYRYDEDSRASARAHPKWRATERCRVVARHFGDIAVSREVVVLPSLSSARRERQADEHSFLNGGGARCFTRVAGSRDGIRMESGIDNLAILKSAGSGFAGFPRDEFTTLAETHERILATRLTATWVFEQAPADYTRANNSIVAAMLKVFATNDSPSVQATLYQMAEGALEAVPEISRVTLAMPNLHCLPVNLKPFGRENKNELFTPTDEPHGVIEATVERK